MTSVELLPGNKYYKEVGYKICEQCGSLYARTRFSTGRLQSIHSFNKRKYCDRLCLYESLVKEKVTRRQHSKRIAHLRKEFCEACGDMKGRKDIHHLDEDYTNDNPSNLMTLCRSCHKKIHKINKEYGISVSIPICKERILQSIF